jgi:hypothetical protein
MPIETGRYCTYCTNADGQLQPFEERFEKMVSWQMRQNPGLPRAQAERETREFMSRMPAWKDHPALTKGR